jgi:glycosyltransferase involved in cell wall biosynthesis
MSALSARPSGRHDGEILAVVPAYNEAGRIEGVIAGLLAAGLPVLVVDDGSRDRTADEARAAGADVLSQPNGGKGKAILSGCRHAVDHGYAAVLLIDADGQHDPSEAPGLIAAWRRGADLVIGTRSLEIENQPTYRRVFNCLSSLLVTLAGGRRVSDSQSGYRVVDPRLVLRMRFSGFRYDLETEMCIFAARGGCRLIEVPVRTIYGDKKSGVHPIVDTYRFFRAVVLSLSRGRRGALEGVS